MTYERCAVAAVDSEVDIGECALEENDLLDVVGVQGMHDDCEGTVCCARVDASIVFAGVCGEDLV